MTTNGRTDDPALDAIMGERRQLLNLGYRLLGSVAEAEDVVQETYARWYAMSPDRREQVVSPGAWLTTVASRICLDLLGSARRRRESYVGEWVPEPVPDRDEWISGRTGGSPPDPADRVTLDESVNMAFLVVLDGMTPAERVAFILHDVFGYPFAEVAGIVGRTPAACRKLASSARRRIRAEQPAPTPSSRREGLVRQFRLACEAGDVTGLIGMLDPEAVLTADGGGRVATAPRPIHGGERIARHLAGLLRLRPGVELLERTVNGQLGLVTRYDGTVDGVVAFDVDGDRISRIWTVRNPEKLRAWGEAT